MEVVSSISAEAAVAAPHSRDGDGHATNVAVAAPLGTGQPTSSAQLDGWMHPIREPVHTVSPLAILEVEHVIAAQCLYEQNCPIAIQLSGSVSSTQLRISVGKGI